MMDGNSTWLTVTQPDVFIKGHRDHDSQFSYQIFAINIDNQLNI